MTTIDGARVLVVGGAGFVGRNLVEMLAEGGAARIVVVDNFLSSDPSEALSSDNVDVIPGSITVDETLRQIDDDFDFAFHLATYHGNQNSIARPLADHENNTLTSLRFFDHIRAFRRLNAVVYSSAGCTVADKTFAEPSATTEADPVSLHMDSPYQISKIVGEMYANFYRARHNVPAVITRFQNVYGPGEILGSGEWRGTAETVWRNVTPTFIFRALTGLPLTVHGDGEMTRDFIFVRDIARGLILAATRGAPGSVYNLASGVETSIRTLASEIASLVSPPATVVMAPGRPWDHSGRRFGSTVKAERELGFRAEVGFDDGLRETVEWSRENLDVIRASVARHRQHLAELDAVRTSMSVAR